MSRSVTASVAVLAALTLAVPAAIAAPAPGWVVDKAASKINFRSAFSGIPVTGGFNAWDAQIAFDPANLAASRVVVTIDMASVTASNGEAKEGLVTADWFDTRRFPRATFTSQRITAAGPGRYQAVGTLNMRGVARPVTLPFTLAIAGNKATMNGALTLDRSQFGVGQGQFKGAETVPHPVQVTVAVVATRR